MSKANPNFTYLKENVPKQRATLLQGGTRSGKTFATIYYIIWFCRKYSGVEIDICRSTYTALKSTVWKDFKDILMKHNLYDQRLHNKTDKIYILNGNYISYYGADDPQKIHGRKRDILWLNEANQLDEETVDQLFVRTNHKVIMDYNPALELDHWLDKYIDKFPPCKTTYKDNPFLTDAQINEIESKKNNAYWWSVYGCGERARPVGAIFSNWSEGQFDESLPYCYGQDYGFSVDPTTLIKVAVNEKKKKIHVHELLHTTNALGTEEIFNTNKRLIDKPTDLIVADAAEDRLIHDLRQKGLNIIPCKKGAGSVVAGITALQDYEIVVTPESMNVKKELNNYCWNDRKSGIPIDDWNHCIDPLRYAQGYLSRPKMFIG
jgi:phage terminase large subunit